jgi:hypothetical protein
MAPRLPHETAAGKTVAAYTDTFKDRAAHLWCENATTLTGIPWAYVKVLQKDFNELQPEDFAALLVLRKDLFG